MRLREDGELPGPPAQRWIRIPALLLLLLGPILGLAFVLFLPVVGIVLIAYLPLQALWQRVRRSRIAQAVGDGGMDGEERA